MIAAFRLLGSQCTDMLKQRHTSSFLVAVASTKRSYTKFDRRKMLAAFAGLL